MRGCCAGLRSGRSRRLCARAACAADPSVPLCGGAGTRQKKGRVFVTPPLLLSTGVEGVDFRFGCLTRHALGGGWAGCKVSSRSRSRRRRRRPPLAAARSRRLASRPSRRIRGRAGFAFETVDRLPVFVAIVIPELAGEVFRVRDLGAVELPGGAGEPTKEPTMRCRWISMARSSMGRGSWRGCRSSPRWFHGFRCNRRRPARKSVPDWRRGLRSGRGAWRVPACRRVWPGCAARLWKRGRSKFWCWVSEP